MRMDNIRDRTMDFKEYQEQAARTDGGNLTAHFLGLCGEAGEVVELFKKHIGHGHELNLVKLEKELGDVLWYISAIATGLGLDLDLIAQYNIDKLKTRYPDKFSAERSINRVEENDDCPAYLGELREPL
jgi:NTP pyrophosphatase (non-canonical NTP hydrolase)